MCVCVCMYLYMILINWQLVPKTLINKLFKQFFVTELYLCLTVEEGGSMIDIYIQGVAKKSGHH